MLIHSQAKVETSSIFILKMDFFCNIKSQLFIVTKQRNINFFKQVRFFNFITSFQNGGPNGSISAYQSEILHTAHNKKVKLTLLRCSFLSFSDLKNNSKHQYKNNATNSRCSNTTPCLLGGIEP